MQYVDGGFECAVCGQIGISGRADEPPLAHSGIGPSTTRRATEDAVSSDGSETFQTNDFAESGLCEKRKALQVPEKCKERCSHCQVGACANQSDSGGEALPGIFGMLPML